MSKKIEFRLVNANEKLESFEIQSFQKLYEKLEKQVIPKNYQCMIISDIAIFKCTYNPDKIITIKALSKKVVTGKDEYSDQVKNIIKKIKKQYELDKKQLNKVVENFSKNCDNAESDLERIEKLLNDDAKEVKTRDEIIEFYKSYEKFNECLSSQISEFDSETKDDIKIKLNHLVQFVEEDILNNYLK